MREKHPVFETVERDAPIWRYFDFPKFISFLDQRALWFSRANLLGDPLEGSFTRTRAAEREALLRNPPEGRTRADLERVFRLNESLFAQMPRCTYINCWHLGDHESMALWHGYGGGKYGVAVRSTFGLLDDLLPKEVPHGLPPQVLIGRVRYIDLASETERVPEEYNTLCSLHV